MSGVRSYEQILVDLRRSSMEIVIFRRDDAGSPETVQHGNRKILERESFEHLSAKGLRRKFPRMNF